MKIVMATRKSALALAQSRAFAAKLMSQHPGLVVEELQLVTSGDKFLQDRLQDLGGKGLFIKELEEALLDNRADIAVHSIKDVPAELCAGLVLPCVPLREDPRDVLVSKHNKKLSELPDGAILGTSSLRRAVNAQAIRPDLVIKPLRGNVGTRMSKVREGEYDATMLALAGLNRLDAAAEASEILSIEQSLPAVGQGALGIECREGDLRVLGLLAPMVDPETDLCVAAERAFMAAVGGSCRLPVAAHARREDSELHFDAMLAESDGTRVRRTSRTVPWPTSRETAIALGVLVGDELRRS